MQDQNDALFQSSSTALEVNKVLKNTYMLLGATLLFSTIMAVVAMAMNVGHGISMVCSIAAIGILWFVLPRTANSEKGILAVFAFTGLLGFGLGPLINHYLNYPGGTAIVANALGGTAIIFFALSGYVLTTKKDFSFLAGFLMTGLIVIFMAVIASIFMNMPVLNLAISAGFIFLMSGFILYETSQIIHGGQRNYILATASLYVSIYNIFTSLLHLLTAMDD